MENGASSWLSALPLKKHSFLLDKQSFWDALYIRYSLPLKRLPSRCVCGAAFNINHALSCPKGGFISLRHNEVRDFTAELISEVCKDVRTEPVLQDITGEEFPPSSITTDDARVDVAARGFWISSAVARSKLLGGAKSAADKKNWCLCRGSLDWLKLPLPVLVLSLCSSSFLVFRWTEN